MAIEHTFKVCEDEFTETLTKARAIRKHCLDCCSGYQGEVAKCNCPKCALFPFRFGNEKGLDRMDHLKEGYRDPELDEDNLESDDSFEDPLEKEEPFEDPLQEKSKPKKVLKKRIKKKRK